jgi:branched-chain amino acid transport system substrate-binding protein
VVAEQVAAALVKNLDILGVVGHFASDTTLAAGKVYQSGQLVAISPVSTSVQLSGFWQLYLSHGTERSLCG